MVYANLSLCCLLIRVIPDAGVVSQCPKMTVTIVNSRCLCKQETHSNFKMSLPRQRLFL